MAKIRETIATELQPTTSGKVRERIDNEQKRLAEEAAREKQLTAARIPLLEAGDDSALNKIEAELNECRTTQLRIQERIELLGNRLDEHEQAEEHAKFEALRDRANRLREFGERLIRNDYAKAAGELASVLQRLRAVDELVETANYALARAGIECVMPTNAIRCQRSRSESVTRKRRVGLRDPEHPYYGRAQLPHNRVSGDDGAEWNPEVTADNGERTRCFVEIEQTVQVHHTAEVQEVLHRAIEVLPSATTSHVPLYASDQPVDQSVLDQLRTEYGL